MFTMTAGDSIVGRMRFDTEGKLVGVHHQTADPAPVTERDLLRSFLSHADLLCINRAC